MSRKDITIFEEQVGEPHADTLKTGRPAQDVVRVDLSYHNKGRGYELHGMVFQRTADSTMIFSIFTGIRTRTTVERATRFSAKRLAALAETLKDDESLVLADVNAMKAELARRLAAGESY